jgi:hypothetical protein
MPVLTSSAVHDPADRVHSAPGLGGDLRERHSSRSAAGYLLPVGGEHDDVATAAEFGYT